MNATGENEQRHTWMFYSLIYSNAPVEFPDCKYFKATWRSCVPQASDQREFRFKGQSDFKAMQHQCINLQFPNLILKNNERCNYQE